MPTVDLGQTEKVAPLTDKNDHADAGRKSHNHGHRNELDDAAHARRAHQHEDDAGHEGCYLKTADAVLGRDSREDGNECAGRSGNLQSTTTQHRDQQAANDGRIQALLRACT